MSPHIETLILSIFYNLFQIVQAAIVVNAFLLYARTIDE